MQNYMKDVLFLVVSVLVLTSCKIDVGNWGNGERIEPSNEIVTKTYKLSPFEEVNMNCFGSVELIQSDDKDGTIELTAPENYIEFYSFESKGNKLDIGFKKRNINIDGTKNKIKVYTNDLIKIQNSGAASIRMDKLDNLKALNVKANVSGVGSISCYASEKLDGNVSGVGSLKYAGHPKHLEKRRTGVGSISEM